MEKYTSSPNQWQSYWWDVSGNWRISPAGILLFQQTAKAQVQKKGLVSCGRRIIQIQLQDPACLVGSHQLTRDFSLPTCRNVFSSKVSSAVYDDTESTHLSSLVMGLGQNAGCCPARISQPGIKPSLYDCRWIPLPSTRGTGGSENHWVVFHLLLKQMLSPG